ncbi:hypothetical protein M3Y99_01115900 [Aphelenchoides fujianensis]|nr:hypothetical protein M3Y99_01115900 [Aphelenchoides fujianensis]
MPPARSTSAASSAVRSPAARSSCAVCSRRASASRSSCSQAAVCRICQSETGVLVHPCVCDGSVNGRDPRALPRPMVRPLGNTRCEICLAEYARTARVLKPLGQWARPQVTSRAVFKLLALVCCALSLYEVSFPHCCSLTAVARQMTLLIVERRTYERLVQHHSGVRSHDLGRFVVVGLLLLAAIAVVIAMIVDVVLYVRRQFVCRFTEHEKHKRTKAAAKEKAALFS